MATTTSTGNNDQGGGDPMRPVKKMKIEAVVDEKVKVAESANEDYDPLHLNKTEIWLSIFECLGPGHFVFVAGVSKRFKELYQLYFSTVAIPNDQLPWVRYDMDGYFEEKPTASSTFYEAVFSSLSCAKYWNNSMKQNNESLEGKYVSMLVAKAGNLPVLEWAHQNRISGFSLFYNACYLAAKRGHTCVLKYAHENYGPCLWNAGMCSAAARGGHLNVLKWLHENGCPWDKTTCEMASEYGHLEVLKWAHEQGCPWDEIACASAAKGGQLEVLKWMKTEGCPWDEYTCACASINGRLHVLQWARQNGCPWDARARSYASMRGYEDIVDWAIANDCP